jgi:very-short-patch-repair endonuclease
LLKPERVKLARYLRRNQSEAEEKLWLSLWKRNLDGVKFRRQQPIGKYIVDFICLEKKLIIEIDGGQHNQSPIIQTDLQRTKWLESKGYRVIRFWNNDVLTNMDGVLIKRFNIRLTLINLSEVQAFSLPGRKLA